MDERITTGIDESVLVEQMGDAPVEERARELATRLTTVFEEDGPGGLGIAASALRIADVALALESCPEELRTRLFMALPSSLAAEVLEEFRPEVRDDILEGSSDDHLIEILNHADADDAIYFLDNMDQDRAERLLACIDDSIRTQVEEQFELPDEAAGHIMTRNVVTLRRFMNVEQALATVRQKVHQEEVGVLYVVDARARLVGTINLRQLVFNPPRTPLPRIMDADPIRVQLQTDREEVGGLMQRYHLDAIPVVDNENRLCGQITWDDAFDIVEAEAEEDMLAIAGTAEDLDRDESIWTRARLRMPWLLMTALGGFVMAKIIHGRTQTTLADFPLLLSFLPLVPALGGNIGIQASTVTVRSMATGELNAGTIFSRAIREVTTGVLLAVVLAVVCTFGALGMITLSGGEPETALVIGISLMFSVVLAACFGVLIPLMCMKLKIDPALAAGPFITMLNDITGVGIYLAIAGLLLGWLS
ncbi:MAG: magnesium transporter [Planctomycetota bacterium]